jgi:hypothetical protein
VDVRGPARVRNRDDRAEAELAIRVSAVDAVTLKVGVPLTLGPTGGMMVIGAASRRSAAPAMSPPPRSDTRPIETGILGQPDLR